MENNNDVYTLDRGKVSHDVINTDNLKNILVDPHNNSRVRDAVKNELNDLQSNINGLPELKQKEYITRVNDIFSKYSGKEKITSLKLVEEISKIASPKLQEQVLKHETKKVARTATQVHQESGFSFKNAIAGFIDKGVKSTGLGSKLASNANMSLDQYEKMASAE